MQDKNDNYLNGYCAGRTDLLKEQLDKSLADQSNHKRKWLRYCATLAGFGAVYTFSVALLGNTYSEYNNYIVAIWLAAQAVDHLLTAHDS